MSELKRCPACGGEARYIGKQVMCCKCSYTIFEHGSTEAAIKAWNNQPRIEELDKKAWYRVKEENKRAIDAEQRNKELEQALKKQYNQAIRDAMKATRYYLKHQDYPTMDKDDYQQGATIACQNIEQKLEQLLKGGE